MREMIIEVIISLAAGFILGLIFILCSRDTLLDSMKGRGKKERLFSRIIHTPHHFFRQFFFIGRRDKLDPIHYFFFLCTCVLAGLTALFLPLVVLLGKPLPLRIALFILLILLALITFIPPKIPWSSDYISYKDHRGHIYYHRKKFSRKKR